MNRGRWRRLPVVIARSVAAHRVPNLAAEAAFFAALALFPALLTVVAVVRASSTLLRGDADAAAVRGMTALLRVVLTSRGSAAAEAAAQLLAGSSNGLLTGGSVVALVLVVRALRSVLHALGTVAGRTPRRWPTAAALAVVTLGGGAVVTAVAVQDPLTVLGLGGLWRWLRWPLIVVALFGWAWTLLRVGGRQGGRVARRAVTLGAAVTTVGWFAASALLPLYVVIVARFSSSLGGLGGGLILLMWLYLLLLSLYLGAELTRYLRYGEADRTAPA